MKSTFITRVTMNQNIQNSVNNNNIDNHINIDEYYRKISPQMTSNLLEIIEQINKNNIENQVIINKIKFIRLLVDAMHDLFPQNHSNNNSNESLGSHQQLSSDIKNYTMECLDDILYYSLKDKLIIEEKSIIGFRYKPNFDRSVFKSLTNDWYCFECHSNRKFFDEQKLINCKTCWRSFHSNCINKQINYYESDYFCIYCIESESSAKIIANNNNIDVLYLNKLLLLVLKNLENFAQNNISRLFRIEETDKNAKMFVFKCFDIISIEYKVKLKLYNSIEEFVNDFKHLIHNYIVCHSIVYNPVYELLSQLKKQLDYEISELKNCFDCYFVSNNHFEDNESDDCFTHVCPKPRELVFAKSAGYPYWPSKVISISKDGKTYHVQYFDSPDFSTATIDKVCVKPIDCKDIELKGLEEPIKLLLKHLNKLQDRGFHHKKAIARFEKFLVKNQMKSRDRKSKETAIPFVWPLKLKIDVILKSISIINEDKEKDCSKFESNNEFFDNLREKASKTISSVSRDQYLDHIESNIEENSLKISDKTNKTITTTFTKVYENEALVKDSDSERKAYNIDNHETHIKIKTKQINKDLSLINNFEVKQEIFDESYRTSSTKKEELKNFQEIKLDINHESYPQLQNFEIKAEDNRDFRTEAISIRVLSPSEIEQEMSDQNNETSVQIKEEVIESYDQRIGSVLEINETNDRLSPIPSTSYSFGSEIIQNSDLKRKKSKVQKKKKKRKDENETNSRPHQRIWSLMSSEIVDVGKIDPKKFSFYD